MLYEKNKFDKKREEIRDKFNSLSSLIKPSIDVVNEYFLEQCNRCENYELREDLEYSANGDLICKSCMVDSEAWHEWNWKNNSIW